PPYLSPEQFLWRRVLHQLDLARNSVLRHRAGDEAKDRLVAAHREADVEVDMEWEDAQDLLFGGGERLPLDFGVAEPDASDPATILDRDSVQTAVSAALKDLPEVQRRAVLLHDLEGYDPAEIAYVLSRTEARVKEDLDTARTTLREKLGGLMT
ncbi:MAG: RNA polymerase sigma factor, partial [Planctomycetota bacterium]